MGAPAHDGVALGHLARAQREAGGHDGREALRDGRHRQRDRDLEVVDRALELRSSKPGGLTCCTSSVAGVAPCCLAMENLHILVFRLRYAGLGPDTRCSHIMARPAAARRELVACAVCVSPHDAHAANGGVRGSSRRPRTQLPWTGSLKRRMFMTQTRTQMTAITCAHAQRALSAGRCTPCTFTPNCRHHPLRSKACLAGWLCRGATVHKLRTFIRLKLSACCKVQAGRHLPWTGTPQNRPASSSRASAPPRTLPWRPCTNHHAQRPATRGALTGYCPALLGPQGPTLPAQCMKYPVANLSHPGCSAF